MIWVLVGVVALLAFMVTSWIRRGRLVRRLRDAGPNWGTLLGIGQTTDRANVHTCTSRPPNMPMFLAFDSRDLVVCTAGGHVLEHRTAPASDVSYISTHQPDSRVRIGDSEYVVSRPRLLVDLQECGWVEPGV